MVAPGHVYGQHTGRLIQDSWREIAANLSYIGGGTFHSRHGLGISSLSLDCLEQNVLQTEIYIERYKTILTKTMQTRVSKEMRYMVLPQTYCLVIKVTKQNK